MLRVSAAHQALRRMRSQRFSWRPPQPGLRYIRASPCCSAQHVSLSLLAEVVRRCLATLALLRGLHQRWGAFLDTVRDDEWHRVADHPEDGEVTLEELLRIYAWHGIHHLNQIMSESAF